MYTFANILHFVLIVIPAIFGLQLLAYKNIRSLTTSILGVLMLLISFYYFLNADYILNELGLEFLPKFFLFFVFLMVNPLYYIYAKSLTHEKFILHPKQLLHFLPSAIVLVLSFMTGNSVEEEKQVLGEINTYSIKLFSVVVYNIQVIIYATGMIVLLRKHKINIKNYFSSSNKDVALNWFKVFVVVFILFSLLDLLVYYIKSLHIQDWSLFYYVLTIFFFVFLGFFGVKQRDIYYEARQLPKDLIDEAEVVTSREDSKTNEKSKKKLISEDKIEELMRKIDELVRDKKQYRHPDLSIYALSKELEINKTYISHVINEVKNQNFSNYINQFRINEAKSLLVDKEMLNCTIEGIANMVGFNSKSSFNSAFKKYEGMTPSEYKKKNLENN